MHTRNHSLVCRWVGISLDIIKIIFSRRLQKLHDTAGKKKRERKKDDDKEKQCLQDQNLRPNLSGFKIYSHGRFATLSAL